MKSTQEKIKILFIHPSSTLYGADVTLLQLIKGLDKNSFEILVIIPKTGPLYDAIEKETVKVILVDMPILARAKYNVKGISSFIIKSITSFSLLKKIIKENKIDIIHSNTMAVFAGALLSKFCSVKHLWHIHEIITHPPFIRIIFPRIFYKTANILIANSNQTALWLKESFPKTGKKIKTIFNGADNSRFHPGIGPNTFRKEINVSAEEVVISMVGRIKRGKGQKLFLMAAALVLEKMSNVSFVIIGDPPIGQEHYLDELKNYLESIPKVKKKTHIFSYRRDIENIYSSSDIIVIPSIEPESFSLVTIEAMATGKPVIASALGGLLDTVEDGRTGILVKPNDVEYLVEAIIMLATDIELRQKLGLNALEQQKKLFSEKKYIKEFSEVYFNMISN